MSTKKREPVIESAAELRALSGKIKDAACIGLDTEFVGERTYVPQLELVQISTADATAVVDCRAVGDLAPLVKTLLDRRIEKVVHAGQQDLEIIFGLTGEVLAPVFDTQLAAAMVGYGAQPSYSALVERLLHTRIEKNQTLTDWSRRPLTATQIAYAHDDVRHLLPIRQRLGERLREMGREEWFREEIQRLEDPETYRRSELSESYLRVRGRGALGRRELAVLRELAAWREAEARSRNKTRNSVLSDELLVEIARRTPDKIESLRNFRGQFARVVERHAEAILAAVRRALELPSDEWPRPPAPARRTAVGTGVIEILQAALRVAAEQAHIAPALVATSADLQALVEAHADGKEGEIRLLKGWRREIAGSGLLSLLKGEAGVRIDPATGEVRLQRLSR